MRLLSTSLFRALRGPLTALSLLLLFAGASAYAAAPTPILLELFTSEGCSSCPPVDAWVNRLDSAQAIPGAQMIVLSEHVDYWDHDGWRDPWSSAQLTERQRAYARALGLSDVYTPQVILDGNVEVQPWKPEQVSAAFLRLAAEPTVPVRLELTNGEQGFLTGRIAIEGRRDQRGGEVWLAVALDHAQSQVTAGENGGKHLTHVAVVRELLRVGTAKGEKDFAQDFRVKLWPGAQPADLRVISFVQQAGMGRVVGAAMVQPGPMTAGRAAEARK